MLMSGEKCACRILEELNVTQPTFSRFPAGEDKKDTRQISRYWSKRSIAKLLIKFLLRIFQSQWAVMSGVLISAELLTITGDFKTQQDKVMQCLLRLYDE